MGHHHIQIPTGLILSSHLRLAGLCILGLLVSLPVLRAETVSSVPNLPEVVIKGGEKKGLSGEKPLLDLPVDPLEAVQTTLGVETEHLLRLPDSLRASRIGHSETLSNDLAILPARDRLAKEPVMTFYPLREILSLPQPYAQEVGKGWEMAITDSEGHPFRKFSGKGLPPLNLRWEGRGGSGEMMDVGQNYTMVITYKDQRSHPRNFVGKPFSFDGIIHQESKGLVLTLASSSLFEQKQDYSEDEEIGESGMELLKESADWIKRNFYNYPVRLEGFFKDTRKAQSRLAQVGKNLESLLLIPRGKTPAQFFATESKSEHIDILIGNR